MVEFFIEGVSARGLRSAIIPIFCHSHTFSPGFCIENEAADDGELSHKGVLGSRLLLLTTGVQSYPTWDTISACEETPYVAMPDGIGLQIFLQLDQARAIIDSLTRNVLQPDSLLPRCLVHITFCSSCFIHVLSVVCRTLIFPESVPGLTILVDTQASIRELCKLENHEQLLLL